MNNKIKNIEKSAITIGSNNKVELSFNEGQSIVDEDTEKALVRIENEINKSGNKKAMNLFEKFKKELQKPEPKKSKLKKIWDGIKDALPSLTGLTDIGIKIAKLFLP